MINPYKLMKEYQEAHDKHSKGTHELQALLSAQRDIFTLLVMDGCDAEEAIEATTRVSYEYHNGAIT